MSSTDLGPLGEITCVAGDAFAVSGADGDIRPGGDHGVYVRDTRFLDRVELLVDGHPPRHLSGQATGADRARFHSYVTRTDDRGVDPTLLVTRRRLVDGCLHEEIEVDNRSGLTRTVVIDLLLGTDFAYIFDVKHARRLPRVPSEPDGGTLTFRRPGAPEQVRLVASEGSECREDGLRWVLELGPHASARMCVDVVATDVYGTARPQGGCAALGEPPRIADRGSVAWVRSSDIRLSRLVRRSLQDLDSLQLPDPAAPDDRFFAAGTPWYLTLFGRDALWAAFMALPYDLALALGTLRTLARRQGTRLDSETEEAPGKILHEVRRGSLVHRGDLPPNYYGTIDATPLFVILVHEAWRWGLPDAHVEELLSHVEAALTWMVDFGAPDDDGFLKYRKVGERGLDNQGWKDSHDGIQFADGRLARAPIALVEVQGYAYAAAIRGAELLDRFGRPGGAHWRQWAAALRERFHARFWLEDDLGPYLAVALDADGVPVDAPASNMGHVLSSGMLDAEQAAAVARRLAHPTLDSGWGLRTLATTATGYNPLSYHGGSVWPHDTAIAAYGCALAGERDAGAALIRGLVAAAPHFQYRLPELFAGIERQPGSFPVPYPAACRPQAWSAAAAMLVLRACLRPDPHLPDGRLGLAPLWPPVFRRLRLAGIPLAGGTLDVAVDEDAGVDAVVHGAAVDLDVSTPDR